MGAPLASGMLNFGNGSQAFHYFILCFVSILGAVQLSAARCNRRELLWLDARTSLVSGVLAIAASLVWFVLADEEIFTPGLAGGEIIAIFSAAFAAAVPSVRAVAFLARWFAASPRGARVKEPIQ